MAFRHSRSTFRRAHNGARSNPSHPVPAKFMSLSLPCKCFKLECHEYDSSSIARVLQQVHMILYIYVCILLYILSKASRLMYANVLLPLSLQSLCYRRHFSKGVELSFIPQATCCCQYAASGCPTRVHCNLKNSLRVCRCRSRKVDWKCAW